MADALSVIPSAVLRNLADKLYEKRKNAALEVEGIVKQLAAAGDHEKISAVINLLTTEFTYSPQANHRKGGLIGLAAATVGLTSEAAQHLEQIVPPVLNSFSDQDSRVRYYACEALYNIAKVVRGDFIIFFNQIFDALCKLSADSDANVQSAAHLLDRLVKDIVTESDQFSIEEFIPLLRERMNVLNPYVRQFLVGWITVLDSVPDIDMLGFLPDFLDGLFNMLSDSSHEIRQQADSALWEFLQEIKNSPSVDYGRMAEILVQRAASPDEFTRLTAITWINEFVKLGGDQLVPYYADILGAILPCISDKEEKIRVVARETNEELRAIKADPADGFDVGPILSIATRQLSSEWEATRIEALHWISTLLNRHRTEVLHFLNDIFDTLLKALSDPSDEVVLLVLEVHACIAKDLQHFRQLVVFLVHNFRVNNSLLEKRGALIIRRLCVLLDAERVYRELSTILEGEADLDFACTMVQTYHHASAVIQSLVEEDLNVKFLVQLDKLIRLLETPIFAYLRLQLLEPGRYTWLLKALYGLLMLLPQQSAAFKILRTRLKTVPSFSFNGEQIKRTSSGNPYSQILHSMPSGSQFSEDGDVNSDVGSSHGGINFASRLQQFEQMQHQHRIHGKAQAQLRSSSTSSSKFFHKLSTDVSTFNLHCSLSTNNLRITTSVAGCAGGAKTPRATSTSSIGHNIVVFIVLFEQSCLFCSLCGLHVPALNNVALASLVCLLFPLVQSVHMVEIDYVGQVDHRPAGDWCMARS
ncbi:protein VAC14-like [Citrus sinensis]|uniref:Protein VAC14-like n=1 Tax=Citrus sinensis TaxID=2711 RepID=A0ACB8N9M9_CITSI|nr:protein VAC14-like [Citrus sinensis]